MPQTDDLTSEFDRTTAVGDAGDGTMTAELDPGWEVGGGILNGGYLLAVVARAAVARSPHPHPVALSAGYLRAASAGPAQLHLTPGTAGRTLAHSSVVLADDRGPLITVQATTGTLAGDEPAYRSAGTRMPVVPRVEDCLDMTAEDVEARAGLVAPGLLTRLDTRLDPATAGWVTGRPAGEPVMRAWVRPAGGRDHDPLSLVALADCLPPSIWAMGAQGWAPTVQLQVLVRALPAPGWCLVEARSGEVAGGWVDEDYRIWDATGRLVAQSRQLARAPRS